MAPLFLRLNNHTLRGTYHVTFGNRLENLAELHNRPDYIDRALNMQPRVITLS